MNLAEIIILAIILSIDAFLVSLSYGVSNLKCRNKTAISLSSGTAIFQSGMFLLGAFFADLIFNFIKNSSTYIAGGIFIILGIKLFFDCDDVNKKIKLEKNENIDISFKIILILSLATSIDAFAAGSSVFLLNTNVWYSAVIIGLITLLNSLLAFHFGEKLRILSPNHIGKLGGILLLLVGLKTIFL